MKKIISVVLIIGLLTSQGVAMAEKTAQTTTGPAISVNPKSMVGTTPVQALGNEKPSLEKTMATLSKRYGTHYAVAVTDLSSGKTVAVNDRSIRSASIIKVFVMVATYKKIKSGELSLDKTLTLTKAVKVGGTGSLQGWPSGSKVPVRTLVEKMITESDNTASNMLVRELGFEYINEAILETGAVHTHLGYWFVLPPPKGVKNTTSATDLNRLFADLYDNKCLGKPYDGIMLSVMSRNKNKSKLPAMLPKKTVVAHKTGSIIRHEHDGGIVYSPGGDFAITVLGEDVPNGEASWKTIASISSEVYKYFNPRIHAAK